jgi:uncharacterized membrane protein
VFTIRVSTLVGAPLERVFAYVADFGNAPAWQHQLAGVRLDEGPFPRGTRVVELRRFLGRRIEAPGELVDWRPLEGFTVRGRSGPLQVESRYSFASEPPGTRVTLQLTMSASGPVRLAEPMLRRSLERELQAAFQRLAVSGAVAAGGETEG